MPSPFLSQRKRRRDHSAWIEVKLRPSVQFCISALQLLNWTGCWSLSSPRKFPSYLRPSSVCRISNSSIFLTMLTADRQNSAKCVGLNCSRFIAIDWTRCAFPWLSLHHHQSLSSPATTLNRHQLLHCLFFHEQMKEISFTGRDFHSIIRRVGISSNSHSLTRFKEKSFRSRNFIVAPNKQTVNGFGHARRYLPLPTKTV